MTIAPDGRVIEVRPSIALADFKVGRGVRAVTLTQMANLAHWVRGRGRCLVPTHATNTALAAGSAVHHYKVKPSGVAIARVWVLDVIAVDTGGGAGFGSFQVKAGGGATSATYGVGVGTYLTSTVVVFEDATKTAAATDLTLEIDWVSGSFIVRTVGCWELPRAALARAGVDLGLSLDSFAQRRPAYESTSEGPFALATLTATLTAKRGTLISSWTEAGIVITGAGYTDIYEAPWRLVPSLDKAADTTRTVTFDLWAYVSVGGTVGDARVVDAAAAASASWTINSTTPAWIGTITKTFKCEDLSTSNGLRGGTYDTAQLQCKRTAGAGNVIIKGWVGYE